MSDKIRHGLIIILLGILLFCLTVYLIRDYKAEKSQSNQTVVESKHLETKDSVDLKKLYDFMVLMETDGDITKISPEDLRKFITADDYTKKLAIELYGGKNKKQITPPDRIILEYD